MERKEGDEKDLQAFLDVRRTAQLICQLFIGPTLLLAVATLNRPTIDPR